MNLKSLYVKILLSFLGVLFIAGILILSLFIVTAGKTFRHHLNKQSIAKLTLFKEMIQEKADRTPLIPLNQNHEVIDQLNTFSDLFDVNIWLTSKDGTVIFKTFSTPVPVRNKIIMGRHDVLQDGIKLFQQSRRHFKYYAQIPIQKADRIVTLHVQLQKWKEKKPEAFFLLGLLTIGLVIAILVVPLSRIITKRLKTLNQKALDFADGNLSVRTDISGSDEIARLGKSFNFMADRLEKMIFDNQELTANISHELRSPLTRIRVSKELIQEKLKKTDNADIYRYVEHIDQDIDVLDDLIDKILKLSKINLQTSPESTEPVDLARVIADLKDKYTPSLDQKNLILEVNTWDGLIFKADKTMVVSILSNLMDNAIKYTQEHGKIRINADREKSDTGRIHFSITNSCPRLDVKELQRIFDPFFRRKGSTGSGTGLGLTIVKKQVRQCNGSIAAKNCPEGLRFEVRF